MFKHLTYSNTFPNGRTLAGSIDFTAGLTAVTGANESGKSFVMEMCRFGLWGSAALRGVAADYKTLDMALEFSVRDEEYRVERKGAVAKLFHDDDQIAVGTKPVNAKIQEIFGYGMPVFDTANAVNQGEIEALGTMLPAARKKMVDQTIGLTVLDNLADWVGQQATSAAGEAEAVDRMLIAPTEPVLPEGYRSAAELKVEADQLRAMVAEKNTINGWLVGEPAKPVAPPAADTMPSADLKLLVSELRPKVAEKRGIEGWLQNNLVEPKGPTCDVVETADALRKWEQGRLQVGTAKAAVQQQLAGMKAPQFQPKELDVFEAMVTMYRLWQRKLEIEKQGSHVDCPKCAHKFRTNHDRLKAEGLDQVIELPAPEYTESQIRSFRQDLVNEPRRLQLQGQLQQLTVEMADRSADLAKRQRYEAAFAAFEKEHSRWVVWLAEAEVKRTRLDDLQLVDDELRVLEKQLASAVAHEAAMAAYEPALARYTAFQEEKTVKVARLGQLYGIEDNYYATTRGLSAAEQYEQALTVYGAAVRSYETGLATVLEKRKRAQQLQLARAAIKALKGKVKAHLVPSLNKVASYLLSQMTGGARNTIVCDEDFNIAVDGQALNTLSGSGKAVANLAIRIGLGQVLTNRVFSVLLADEIDAAMDQDRAEFTAECLRNLKKSIGQIVLISHKRPEADQYVDL